MTHLDGHAIELHLQNVVDQGLVGPAVAEHGHEVDVAVENDEQGPLQGRRGAGKEA